MSEPNYPHLDKNQPYPLAGILVIDFTHVLSGPTCSRMLADAGARVIHVERKTGDDTRHMGPYLADGSSEYFRICNTGKESIALDLKNAQDHALAEKMIAKADVVVENFRPGVMTRLGFDPEEMVKKYPKLIFASISGFGQYGPFEAGETERDAARREVFEEVGLKPKFDFDFQESYSYKVTSKIEKTVTLFLAKYKADQKIKRQESEIRSTDWLNYQAAQERISKQNFKEFRSEDLSAILAKANDYLVNREGQKETHF